MSARVSPHFTVKEMRCKGSGLLRFHPRFLDELEALRVTYGRRMDVTSGCRSSEHNTAIGGSPNSWHRGDVRWPDGSIGAMAVDVRIGAPQDAWRLGGLAIEAGWSVGVSTRGFIHLDARFLVGAPPALFGYA